MNATYNHLEQLYVLERHLESEGFGILSNIQKQNVTLALKIFLDKNMVALKYLKKSSRRSLEEYK